MFILIVGVMNYAKLSGAKYIIISENLKYFYTSVVQKIKEQILNIFYLINNYMYFTLFTKHRYPLIKSIHPF